MPKNNESKPLHPGLHIKDRVVPVGLSVKAAAELLGVGRSALAGLAPFNRDSGGGVMHDAPAADPEPITLSAPPSNRVEGGLKS